MHAVLHNEFYKYLSTQINQNGMPSENIICLQNAC